MGFDALLKKVCKNCTDTSRAVYLRSTKRLHKLLKPDAKELPDTGKWLSDSALKKKYRALPLSSRRHLSSAAVKAARAYGVSDEYWVEQMTKDSDEYQSKRSKRKLTDAEEQKIPKDGYKAIKKLASEYARRNKRAWATRTSQGIYKRGIWFLLKLMSAIPLRNTAASLRIADDGESNALVIPKKGLGKRIIRQHKAAKKIGTKTIPLTRALTTAARAFLRYRGDLEHDRVFSNTSGGPLSKSALGKTLHRVTGDLLGKKFGSRMIRILAARANSEVLEQAQKLSNAMLHGDEKQTLQYAKK